MVPKRHGDFNFFDIVTWFLQKDTLAPFLFNICQDYQLWVSIGLKKVNCFTVKNSRRYPAETITGADYADDQALLTIKPTQAESWLYCVEQFICNKGIKSISYRLYCHTTNTCL